MISNVSDIWHQHIKAISTNVFDMADKMNDFPTPLATWFIDIVLELEQSIFLECKKLSFFLVSWITLFLYVRCVRVNTKNITRMAFILVYYT